MKEMLRIYLGDCKDKYVSFGMPDSQAELNEMFSLRYKAYSRKFFIEENNLGLDIDHYDEIGAC
ncbi:MAG: hypothetical protein JW816_02355, partial [Candidatus Buchananbacteria bacterium]|nr:hypothetical protein [Candidatus Buchananbacteria bacterium]